MSDNPKDYNPELDFIATEFAKAFPSEQMPKNIKDAFANEGLVDDSELESVFSQTSNEIGPRRDFLLRALNVLDYAWKEGKIQENATFESLYKIIGSEAVKLNETKRQINSNEDRNLVATFKALVELKSEKFNNQATLPEIIAALGQKFDALKGL